MHVLFDLLYHASKCSQQKYSYTCLLVKYMISLFRYGFSEVCMSSLQYNPQAYSKINVPNAVEKAELFSCPLKCKAGFGVFLLQVQYVLLNRIYLCQWSFILSDPNCKLKVTWSTFCQFYLGSHNIPAQLQFVQLVSRNREVEAFMHPPNQKLTH